jgi:hypothetical protein
MSSYSVVSIPQCCINTTVSHYEIYTELYHYVKQYRPIPHDEIYTGLYHIVKLYWTVPHYGIGSVYGGDAPILGIYTVLMLVTTQT